MRYQILDIIRGLVLINMIAYHVIWDCAYIFDVKIGWYQSFGSYLWQQSICCTFIFLAGFCWSMSRNPIKRGLIVSSAGILITIITVVFMPEDSVVFGILTCIGFNMLLMVLMDKVFKIIPDKIGIIASLFLFIKTKNINDGYIGIAKILFIEIPDGFRRGMVATFFGFKDYDFYSVDYFSIIPWCFLFFAGYFAHKIWMKSKMKKNIYFSKLKLIEFMGKHSLEIYLIHQPIVYGVLLLVFQ